jgi:hypothetical protein
LGCFFHSSVYAIFFTQIGLGYILGDFFDKFIWSQWEGMTEVEDWFFDWFNKNKLGPSCFLPSMTLINNIKAKF